MCIRDRRCGVRVGGRIDWDVAARAGARVRDGGGRRLGGRVVQRPARRPLRRRPLRRQLLLLMC
eukprot:2546710-Prymnesium_polylepis.1